MSNEFERDEFGTDSPVEEITRAVVLAITSVVTIGIALLCMLVVLVLGVWLAFVYLPPNLFRILAVIVLVDIALGIVIRTLLARRRGA